MKKLLALFAVAVLVFISCRKEVTCTCKDHSGNLVKRSSLKSNKQETNAFKADCEKTKVSSLSGTTTVYTPCVLE
jgi:hypothetical protein